MANDAGRGTNGTLEYFGGPVISNVVVREIFWGTTGFDPSYQAMIGGFYSTILKSGWWSWLAEYNTVGLNGAADNKPGSNQIIGPGTFGGSISITPANTSTTLAPNDIANEIQAQMMAGVIPPLDIDASGNVNTLFMVDLPAPVTVNDMGSQSCVDWCGEHTTFTMMQGGVMYDVPYALLPDHFSGPCLDGCGSLTPFENACSTASHELAESVTDPAAGLASFLSRPLAWFDAVFSPGMASGEIGDLCVGEEGVATGTTDGGTVSYTVQKLWSNLNNGCIEAAPPCNGTTQPPFCTPCTAADNGIGCNGTTPVCETDATSSRAGQCVECNAATPCPNGATSFCQATGATADTCRGCEASDCTGTTPVCETSGPQQGQCVGCDATHTAACTGATPICDTTEFTCVGCMTAATCAAATPICDMSTQLCRACLGPADCDGKVCVTEAGSAKVGQCVPCTGDADCTGNSAGPVCSAGVCVPGMAPSDAGKGSSDGGHASGADSGAPVDAGHSKADAGTSSKGSSGGCAVAHGATDVPWEIGFALAFGVPFVRRRRART
jgi:hypothetical protein